jgi:hypothetical protein
MAAKTTAQEEFDNIFATSTSRLDKHPEDYESNEANEDELDEDAVFRQRQIEETMGMPILDRVGKVTYKLPHQSFDSGRTTGVKGVIADARHYQQMKAGGRRDIPPSADVSRNDRPNGPLLSRKQKSRGQGESYINSDSEDDDEEFLERWRETRRKELLGVGNDIRNRRTSPSMRRYGKFDEVDALGYLDAIEKVGRETIVVVFVYDPEVRLFSLAMYLIPCTLLTTLQCPVSQVIEDALAPLVPEYPAVHFVKVDYEAIEFENAGVPAILAYHRQGELFANLTYIIDSIPDDTLFDTKALKDVLVKNNIL